MQQAEPNPNTTAASELPVPAGHEGQQPLISVRNLVKRFGSQTVLDGVSFDVYAGETLVIMGGSGSGKSTMLRCMIGSLKPEEGSVHLFGKNICDMEENELNETRKRFGILFQSGALFNSMTVGENVALPIQEHTDLDANIIEIIVKTKLEMVSLREHAHKYPAQISGGMKKRAGLARALALDPQILFYDEPSAGLDPVTSSQIDELMVDLTRKLGVASVVVTHEMDSAFVIADRMAMFNKGVMMCVRERAYFETLRDTQGPGSPDYDKLSNDERLIRQFLRGDAEGPISEQQQDNSSYTKDLLKIQTAITGNTPSVMTTRRKARGAMETSLVPKDPA